MNKRVKAFMVKSIIMCSMSGFVCGLFFIVMLLGGGNPPFIAWGIVTALVVFVVFITEIVIPWVGQYTEKITKWMDK